MKVLGILTIVAAASALSMNAQEVASTQRGDSHSVYVNGGFSHIYSDVKSNWTSGDPRLGWDWQAGYDWVGHKGFGAGFLYSGYIATGEEQYLSLHTDESVMLNYFAPQFVYNWSRPSSRWDFFVKAGLGFIMITEHANLSHNNGGMRATKGGLGSNITLGTEFKINRHFGITASLSGVNAYIHQDNSEYDMPDGNGLARVSLNLGIKYHL